MDKNEKDKPPMTQVEKRGWYFFAIYFGILTLGVLTLKIGSNKEGRPYYQREWVDIFNALPTLMIVIFFLAFGVLLLLIYGKKI